MKFFAPGEGVAAHPNGYAAGYFYLHSQRVEDNGVYRVAVTAVISGQKTTSDTWTYDISLVSPNSDYSVDITFKDPCETATLNPSGEATTRTPIDHFIGVKGAASTDNIYEYADSVSLAYDKVYAASNVKGIRVCGDRVYTFAPNVATTSWLTFDQTNDGLITVQATLQSEVEFSESGTNPGRYGHEVTISVQLNLYASVTTTSVFYVEITECVLSSFAMEGSTMQENVDYTLYTGLLTVDIKNYVQVPDCGYDVLMSFIETGGKSTTWMTKPVDSWQWNIESENKNDAEDYAIR